jgi:hypothetical protein
MTDKHRRENCEDDVLCSRKKAWCGNKEEITLIWLTRTELHTNNNEAEIILKQLHEINNYRGSQKDRTPHQILGIIRISPTKEEFIPDLLPYPWTHSSSLSYAILV